MSESGRKVLFVFLILTIVLLVMEEIGIDGDALIFARYTVVIVLGTVAYSRKGLTNEQRVLSSAFPLMIMGDFFLVLSYLFNGFPSELRYIGFIPFTIAYMLIARIYIKGFRWNPWLVLPTVVYGLFLVLLGVFILPHISGVEILLGMLVASALIAMAWAGASSIWNGYYARRTSILMALSGLLMLLCDFGVAFDLFYPNISSIKALLEINVVWLTYIPGWTILALVVMEREFHTHVYEH